ncbi:MAG TPA: DUF885 domain-containing protein [Candidatus Limnocylindrales bacterium]|jgi:uncharacterized protein (DUF885 family)
MTNETAAPPPVAGDANELATLAAEAWESQMVAHPVYATVLGDRRYDDRLRDNGPNALADESARLGGLLARAEGIDASRLSAADQVTRSALVDFLRFELDLIEAGLDAWAVDPLDGPQVAYMNIPALQPVRTVAEGEALVARWREIGPWIDRLTGTTREHLSRGVAAPHALVRSVVAELDDLLEGDVEEWPLNEPADDVPADWSDAARTAHARDVRAAVATQIRPAFARYRAFLVDELGPVARDDERPGLSHIPGGLEAYRRLVRSHTTLDLEPDEIHRIGLEETERIDAEFRELGDRILGTSNQATVLQRLRTDPALHFATSAEVFDVAEGSLARANAAIPDWFGQLPQAPCVVIEMGPHEAKYSTIAYYRGPAADGSRPGGYYINTTEPKTRTRYEAETLAFHEAVPGHHLQIAIAQGLEGLPAFRRHGGPTAYIEGWGLYSERLSAEMGLHSGEMDRFGIASYDAWRACRLVVDTGLHALGWDRERAIRFMTDHTALAENNIVNEVDRYLAMPGQALAYKLGQREILALRAESQAALGPGFDIRTFHDVVLGQGAVALSTLRGVVEAWIRAD